MTDLNESVRRLREAEIFGLDEGRWVSVDRADLGAVLDALERRTAALRECWESLDAWHDHEQGRRCYECADAFALIARINAALAGEEPR